MKLKVCGMKYQDNMNQVALLQPDYLGFIFYDGSSRFFDGVMPQLSKKISKVGVFVNASLQNIIEKIRKYDLQAVQLHGEESPVFCEKLKKQCADQSKEVVKIIKVFSIKEEFNFDILRPYEAVCDYFLFDTKGKLPGGNGYAFNWKVLRDYPSTTPYFLSGGIGLNEMADVKSFLQKKESKYCHAIDINSRFEIEPGMKNIEELKEFKRQLRQFE
ncbi:MAG: phosphoribosylanthranilate isomerase [Aureibaculum sp.]